MLGDRLWQVSLPLISICPFNLSVFIPLLLAELSPGAPALFSEAAAHLKKLELETVKAAGPWPALHININKVPRNRTGDEHGPGAHVKPLIITLVCLLNPVPLSWRGFYSTFPDVSAQHISYGQRFPYILFGSITA